MYFALSGIRSFQNACIARRAKEKPENAAKRGVELFPPLCPEISDAGYTIVCSNQIRIFTLHFILFALLSGTDKIRGQLQTWGLGIGDSVSLFC